MSVVVDASVAAKWLLQESDSDRALALLAEWRDGHLEGFAPDILAAEVANALWRRVMGGLIPVEAAEQLFARFYRLEFPLLPIGDLAGAALGLALRHSHPVYDCLYVALALETRSDLVTADTRLVRALGSAYPRVCLLRDWRP
jgi:predicted nucleic acid-binding protein